MIEWRIGTGLFLHFFPIWGQAFLWKKVKKNACPQIGIREENMGREISEEEQAKIKEMIDELMQKAKRHLRNI